MYPKRRCRFILFGRTSTSAPVHRESLAIFRELNSSRGMAMAIGNLGVIAQYLGDYETALRQSEEALALVGEFRLLPWVARYLLNIANILSLTGRHDEAAERLAECRRVLDLIDDVSVEERMPIIEALMAYRRAEYGEALRFAQAAPVYTQERHLALRESFCWLLVGLVEIKRNHLRGPAAHPHQSPRFTNERRHHARHLWLSCFVRRRRAVGAGVRTGSTGPPSPGHHI